MDQGLWQTIISFDFLYSSLDLNKIVIWETHCTTMQTGTVSGLWLCRRSWGLKHRPHCKYSQWRQNTTTTTNTNTTTTLHHDSNIHDTGLALCHRVILDSVAPQPVRGKAVGGPTKSHNTNAQQDKDRLCVNCVFRNKCSHTVILKSYTRGEICAYLAVRHLFPWVRNVGTPACYARHERHEQDAQSQLADDQRNGQDRRTRCCKLPSRGKRAPTANQPSWSSRTVMLEEARIEPRNRKQPQKRSWRKQRRREQHVYEDSEKDIGENQKRAMPTAMPTAGERAMPTAGKRATPTAGEESKCAVKQLIRYLEVHRESDHQESEVRNVRDEAEWCRERRHHSKTSETGRGEHSVGHCRDQHMKNPMKRERPRTEVLEWSSCRHWYTVQQGQADVQAETSGRIANTVACEEAWNCELWMVRITVGKLTFMTTWRADMQHWFSLDTRWEDSWTEI